MDSRCMSFNFQAPFRSDNVLLCTASVPNKAVEIAVVSMKRYVFDAVLSPSLFSNFEKRLLTMSIFSEQGWCLRRVLNCSHAIIP